MVKRMLDTGIWTDPYIVDNFSVDDKYFWVYLLTNGHNTICGTCCLSLKTISDEMGLSKDIVKVLLERFEKKYKYILYDEEKSEILILKWYRHNWTNSSLLKVNIEKCLKTVKSQKHIAFLEEIINQINWGEKESNVCRIELNIEGINRVSIGYQYPTISNSITNNSNNTNIIGGIVKGGEELKPLENTLKAVLTSCQTHCPKLYERHLARPNSDYSLGQLLMDFTPPADLDAFFKHISKTYIVQPKYQQLDLLWVLNNYDKANGTAEEDEQPKWDKPKNTLNDYPQREYKEEDLRAAFGDIGDAEV